MAGKAVFEYGLLVAPLGTADSDFSLSKSSFFALLDAQYPSSEGWEVWDTNTVPSGTGVIVIYHTKRALK